MKNNLNTFRCLSVVLATLWGLPLHAADNLNLGDITVTGTREQTSKSETPATVDSVDQQAIDFVRPAHPSEIMNRIAGVYVDPTNGEGHITAIRQPLTTNSVYLYLEDGIPTRSTGFFNHNALFEVDVPQAAGIEVTKGPGSALYGSDAIGGVVNILTRPAPQKAEADVNVEVGAYGWRRLLGSAGNTWGEDGVRANLNLTHTDGWRHGTDYDRQSAQVRWDRLMDDENSLKVLLTGSNIDQQTAGSSYLSQYDYLHHPTKNLYPISYRDVQAYRFSAAYEKETADSLLSVTPYLRYDNMEYMANWSFGYDPNITKTNNDSFGLQLKYRRDFAPMTTRVIVGTDIDYSPGSHDDHSINAVKDANGIYSSYTLGPTIYNYDVAYTGISPYLHVESSLSEKARLTAGLRYDSMSYDYNNKLADGPLTVVTTSAGSRTYNHPADTTVDFSQLSPKLGITYAFLPNFNGFLSYRHAFRAPTESDLFRPGSSAASLDLKPVKADSYETGVRGNQGPLRYEVSYYYMTKTDDLVTFKDQVTGNQYTTNAGKTLHRGVEITAGSRLSKDWLFDLGYSYAKHTYLEWKTATVDYTGKEMSSAPNEIIDAHLDYTPALLNGGKAELEWAHLGPYWMDDANTARYSGHDLLNLRSDYFVNKKLELYARVMNLADKRYATVATLSYGNKNFAPGMPRTFYAGVTAKF